MPRVLVHPQDVLSPQAVVAVGEVAEFMEWWVVLAAGLDQMEQY
jgi:hypothetical protein